MIAVQQLGVQKKAAVPVAIQDLESNPWQPRQSIDQSQLTDLIYSINQFGWTGYLEARRRRDKPGTWQLVFGHRRLQAAVLAGLKHLPIVEVDYTDAQMAELAILENTTVEPLSFWEEGLALRKLVDEFGYSVRELGKIMDKGRTYVHSRLQVVSLPEDSPLSKAARTGQTDITTILTLSALAKSMDQEEIDELLARAAAGELTADQLKQMRKALKDGMNELRDEYAIGAGEPPALPTIIPDADFMAERQEQREASEARYHQFITNERAQFGFDEIRPIAIESVEIVRPTDTPGPVELPALAFPAPAPEEWTPIASKRPEDGPKEYAQYAINQLKDNIHYLTIKLEKADFRLVTDEERATWDALRQQMISLLS